MAEEARQTSLHDHSFWGENSKLRNSPVLFISAGNIDPLQAVDSTDEDDETGEIQPTSDHYSQEKADSHRALSTEADLSLRLAHDRQRTVVSPNNGVDCCANDQIEEQSSFFFDIQPSKKEHRQPGRPLKLPERSISGEESSGDEVILFRGRNHRGLARTSSIHTAFTTQNNGTESCDAKETNIYDHVQPELSMHTKQPKKAIRRVTKKNRSSDDDMLADYIANLRDNGELDSILTHPSHNRRDLGGSITNGAVGDLSSDSESNTSEQPVKGGGGWETETEPKMSMEATFEEESLATLIAKQALDSDPAQIDEKHSSSESETNDGSIRTLDQGAVQDEFDFMDWNRPSLRRQRKGKNRRTEISFDAGDSDLERQLQVAWKSDRLKKTERNKHREQLRALGLLRKKTDPDDLRVKYPSGMSVQEVAEELRTFLQTADEM